MCLLLVMLLFLSLYYPEGLVYLFIAISIGLVLGANQRIIALLGFAVIMVIVWARFITRKPLSHQNLFLTVQAPEEGKLELSILLKLVD